MARSVGEGKGTNDTSTDQHLLAARVGHGSLCVEVEWVLLINPHAVQTDKNSLQDQGAGNVCKVGEGRRIFSSFPSVPRHEFCRSWRGSCSLCPRCSQATVQG